MRQPLTDHIRTQAAREAKDICERHLGERGVRLHELADLVLRLQRAYVPGLELGECLESVEAVLSKREVCNALLTGIALDRLAEEGGLPEPLLTTVRHDDPLYGIDEVLALSIVNMYGSIGFTNFGYLDKVKPGAIGRVDRRGHGQGRCNTFLDDLIAAVVAAAAARIAHRHRDTLGEAAGAPLAAPAGARAGGAWNEGGVRGNSALDPRGAAARTPPTGGGPGLGPAGAR